MKKVDLKRLIVSFSIVAILVLLSMIFTKNTMDFYKEINRPELAPPAILFPVVWTILYSIIAITLYYFRDNKEIKTSIIINLVINVIWPILFFRFKLLFFSAIWLILIIISLILALKKISKVDKRFLYLNLPYLFWLIFAFYLNFMIFILN